MDIYSVLDSVGRHPEAYLYDGRSLTSLYGFLMGYECGRSSKGLDESIFGELRDFTVWVACELAVKAGTRGWCAIILESTASEEEAFDRFYELLERFKIRSHK